MDYCASLSYGKDSMAMLYVITDVLHKPLERIVTADIWATDELQAELPEMVEFKTYADEEIKKRWDITVEHYSSDSTYEQQFYRLRKERSKRTGQIYGWPMIKGPWCNGLKRDALKKAKNAILGSVEYIGIAADEPERIQRWNGRAGKELPLVEAGWTEKMCRDWCEQNNLLSPIYSMFTRGGVGFVIIRA